MRPPAMNMLRPRSPLRAAFWAISAALGLILLLTLSDPQAVRRDLLLAGREPAPGSIASEDVRVAQDHPGEASPVARQGTSEPLPGREIPPPIPAMTVSTESADPDSRDGIISSRPAMPILTPSHLTARGRGEFIELPPPPGMEYAEADEASRALWSDFSDAPAVYSTDTSPASPNLRADQLRLEADLLRLRAEVATLTELRRADDLYHLRQTQTALLEGQQATVERLDRLADLIESRADQLIALRQQADGTDAGPSRRTGEPHLEQLVGGGERFSLIIESDDIQGVLERLGRWSNASAAAPTASPVVVEPVSETPPQYITPPVRQPTPAVIAPHRTPTRPTATGPTLAAPCNCN